MTFERNQEACRTLIPSLLEAFDSRYWLSISNIFLNISKGTGFGQVCHAASQYIFVDSQGPWSTYILGWGLSCAVRVVGGP